MNEKITDSKFGNSNDFSEQEIPKIGVQIQHTLFSFGVRRTSHVFFVKKWFVL